MSERIPPSTPSKNESAGVSHQLAGHLPHNVLERESLPRTVRVGVVGPRTTSRSPFRVADYSATAAAAAAAATTTAGAGAATSGILASVCADKEPVGDLYVYVAPFRKSRRETRGEQQQDEKNSKEGGARVGVLL